MTSKGLVIGESGGRTGRPLAVRRRRRDWRRILLRAGGAAMILGAAGLATGWLLTAPLFAVTRVEAGPYRFTEREPLEEILRGALGRNLWSYRTAELRDGLLALPWVRAVHVVRRLPATLQVEIVEWRPLLAVTPAAGSAAAPADAPVLREDGRVLGFPPHLPAPALPVLVGCGLEPAGPGAGWRLAGTGAAGVLGLVAAIAAAGLESVGPVDFIVAREDGFLIQLGDAGGRLLLGREDFAARLRLYMETRDRLADQVEVDLRFRGRIGVASRA